MTITGNVMNASIEERDLVGKDGVKKHSKISHVLMSVGEVGKAFEVVNLRAYDADFQLPKIGEKWTSPRVRKYENFDGQVAEVMV